MADHSSCDMTRWQWRRPVSITSFPLRSFIKYRSINSRLHMWPDFGRPLQATKGTTIEPSKRWCSRHSDILSLLQSLKRTTSLNVTSPPLCHVSTQNEMCKKLHFYTVNPPRIRPIYLSKSEYGSTNIFDEPRPKKCVKFVLKLANKIKVQVECSSVETIWYISHKDSM